MNAPVVTVEFQIDHQAPPVDRSELIEAVAAVLISARDRRRERPDADLESPERADA